MTSCYTHLGTPTHGFGRVGGGSGGGGGGEEGGWGDVDWGAGWHLMIVKIMILM